jgi:4-hydroxymandelate synthase
VRAPRTASTAPAMGGERGWPVELDLLELWVGDLARTRRMLTAAFAFQPRSIAVRCGPDESAACLSSGEISVVVRQGATVTSPVSRHVAVHGDTIADVALVSADPDAVADRALAHGLQVWDSAGTPTIDLFGDRTVCHSLRPAKLFPDPVPSRAGPEIQGIDHVAYCLPWGFAETAARAYEAVLGLQRVDVGDAEKVGGDVAGMRSVVLRSAAGFTVVLTEPLSRASTGQTQRFVDAHVGPGVQHAAFAYDDLFTAVESLRGRGVHFLPIPDDYYVQARQRLAHLPIPWDVLRRLGILVDADDRGLLFQLFTLPLTAQGTFFAELIQRGGALGFGANNVRALFAAVHTAMGDGPARMFVMEDR